jgi:hypothetical protein
MQTRLAVTALAAFLSVLAASPSVAHAATPCYKRVISDWTADGVINGHYSPHCLRQAIKKVPEDLRDYSPILDDINAALIDALAVKNGTNNNGPGSGPGPSTSGGNNTSGGKLTPAEAKKRAEQAVPHAGTAGSIPDSSRSLPLPLLILAGIAAAALLAAASLPLIQRIRARSPRPRPTPRPEP